MGGMQKVQTKKFSKQRHFLAVFFLSFMWGTFGVDRMYLGKWGTGILKLVTLGGFGVWTLVDLALVMSGATRDKQGREMLQVVEYKGFAAKLVLIFAVALGLIVLLNGIALLVMVAQLFTDLQNGTTPEFLNGLQGLPGTGLTPAQREEFGL